MPFGDTLWRHARAIADRRGPQKAQEAEIAAIADDLLDRAAAGPQERTKAERRLTGRTIAASTGRHSPSTSQPDREPPLAADPADNGQIASDSGEDVADVIPLPVFDARKEAQSWRL